MSARISRRAVLTRRRRDVNWTAPVAFAAGVIAMAMLIAQAYARIERRRIDWVGGTA